MLRLTTEVAPGAGAPLATELDGNGAHIIKTVSVGSTGLAGKAFVDKARHDHVTPVTTSAWTTLVASLADDVSQIEVFDSSGKLLKLGFGPAGQEAEGPFLFPGGNGPVPLSIPAGTRVAVRAVDANTAAGSYLAVNFYK